MREIKFRGKVKGTKDWVHGSLLIYGDGEHNIHVPRKNNSKLDAWNVEPDTVGQFTGLKDGNGKEVYEGDIVMTYVLFVDEEEVQREFWRVGEVRFIAGGFSLINCTNYDDHYMEVKSELQPSPKSKFPFPAYCSEVIGNIFDNPILIY